jgi:hypothetical protein
LSSHLSTGFQDWPLLSRFNSAAAGQAMQCLVFTLGDVSGLFELCHKCVKPDQYWLKYITTILLVLYECATWSHTKGRT